MQSDQVLKDILVRGIVRKDDICAAVDASSYFVKPGKEPAWRTLWLLAERTDEQAQTALVALEHEFVDRKFLDIREFLQVVGVRLWLSRIKLLNKGPSEVVVECKEYIDDLYQRQELEPIVGSRRGMGVFDGFGGLEVRETGTEEFQEVNRHLRGKRLLAAEDFYRMEAPNILSLIDDSPELFLRRINITNSDDNLYFDVPILAYIPPDEFVLRTLKAHPEKQVTIFRALRLRYEHGRLSNELATELPWIESIREKFVSAAANMSPIGKYRVLELVKSGLEPFCGDPKETKGASPA